MSASAQKAKFDTWKITASQTGGFAGINKIRELDSRGNLKQTDKRKETLRKINRRKIAEIDRLVKELDLRGTRQKTVKGDRIYDGIYSQFVITLEGKEYRIEGNSFDDSKYLALSRKQQATLGKLKSKLNELQGFYPIG